MEKDNISKSAIANVLSSLSRGFAQQKQATGIQLMETLGSEAIERLDAIIKKTCSGDLSELDLLEKYFDIPKSHYQELIPQRYPNLSCEQHEQIVFFLTHYDDLERTAARWFSDLEGGACSADRSRTLRRLLWRYLTIGTPPEPNYAQRYTYHLSKGTLVDAREFIEWFDAYRDLQKGDLTPYALLLHEGRERLSRRRETPQLPSHRLPSAELFFDFNEIKGLHYFVARACVSLYLEDIDHPDARAHMIEFGSEISELEPHFDETSYIELKDAISSWVYKPGPIELPAFFGKLGVSADEMLNFITHRADSVNFGKNDAYREAKKALLEKLSEQEGVQHD